MKTCAICNIEKDDSNFRPQRAQCKECLNIKRCENRVIKIEKQKALEEEGLMKECSKCNAQRLLSEFKVNSSQCKDCINERRRELNQSKRPAKPESVNPDNKICSYCHVEQPKCNFREKRLKCLNCERKDGREYRQSDYGKLKSETWVIENKERMQELQANWFQENKSKIYTKRSERMKTDEKFRFIANYRKKTRVALKQAMIGQNPKKFIDCLGCDLEHLQNWFSLCFKSDMTFENYGTLWEIDHVIPINKFEFEDSTDIELCFSWFNVMPLYKTENMNKKAEVCNEQLREHLENLSKFGFNDFDYLELCAKHLDAGNP